MKLKQLTLAGSALALVAATPAWGSLIFSLDHNNLPESGPVTSWDGATAKGSPEVTVINGQKWSANVYADGDGYRVAGPTTSTTLAGASFVVAAMRGTATVGTPWTSIIDVMYDKLTLGIRNDTGQIVVRRNGSVDNSIGTIAVDQATVLSLTVQTDGSYEVWADGISMLSGGANGTMTEWDPNRIAFFDEPDWASTTGLAGNWDSWWSYVMAAEPTVTAAWDWGNFNALANRDTYWGYDSEVQEFKKFIDVGRNDPDGWTAFNGNIGDVMIFDEALSESERLSLVAAMTAAMAVPEPSILGLLALAPVLAMRRRRA